MGVIEPPSQSGFTRQAKNQGSTYLRSYLGQAAIGAAKASTFLAERYRRIARRRGGKAQVAVARPILVIIWHLLSNCAARYTDLGPGHYETAINKNRKARSHIANSKPSATPAHSPRPPEPDPHHRRASPRPGRRCRTSG